MGGCCSKEYDVLAPLGRYSRNTTMRRVKKARLEKKGWRFGSVQDFLGLSAEETRFFELADRLAHAKDAAERSHLKEALARLNFGE